MATELTPRLDKVLHAVVSFLDDNCAGGDLPPNVERRGLALRAELLEAYDEAKAGQWRDPKTNQPEKGAEVLFVVGGWVLRGTASGEGYFLSANPHGMCDFTPDEVTHWRPLPVAP